MITLDVIVIFICPECDRTLRVAGKGELVL